MIFQLSSDNHVPSGHYKVNQHGGTAPTVYLNGGYVGLSICFFLVGCQSDNQFSDASPGADKKQPHSSFSWEIHSTELLFAQDQQFSNTLS